LSLPSRCAGDSLEPGAAGMDPRIAANQRDQFTGCAQRRRMRSSQVKASEADLA
jgi:hypothetical protein